jgi:hypothetical protein
MAHSSKNGSSLRPAGPTREAWKHAPSRETTHDDPQGHDAALERKRKPLENAPGKGNRKSPNDPRPSR